MRFFIVQYYYYYWLFWLLSTIYDILTNCRLFFERKFDFLPQEANNVNSMVYLLSAALSPFFGILIDKTGRNVTWVIISIVTTLAAHFMLAFTFLNPYIGVVSINMNIKMNLHKNLYFKSKNLHNEKHQLYNNWSIVTYVFIL